MVEVFKTNVKNERQADMLLNLIHRNFNAYKANFDLDDCDKILRVKSLHQEVQPKYLIDLLSDLGVEAEVLPDNQPIVPANTRYMCCMHAFSKK